MVNLRLVGRLGRKDGPDAAAAAPAAASVDPQVRLRHLQELHDEGFLADAEFELARAEAAERRLGERRRHGERRRGKEGWLAWAGRERRSGEDRRQCERRAAERPADVA